MEPEKVIKLFEKLLDEKYKADLIDMQIGKDPRTLAKYLIDYLYKQVGLKSLVLKQLSSLTISLENLSNEDRPYAKLFCRMLGVFTQNPVEH